MMVGIKIFVPDTGEPRIIRHKWLYFRKWECIWNYCLLLSDQPDLGGSGKRVKVLSFIRKWFPSLREREKGGPSLCFWKLNFSEHLGVEQPVRGFMTIFSEDLLWPSAVFKKTNAPNMGREQNEKACGFWQLYLPFSKMDKIVVGPSSKPVKFPSFHL